MTFWYQAGLLRKRIGKLIDFYDEYLELQDCETGEFVLKHWTNVEYINNL